MEEIEREAEGLIEKGLLAAAKEFRTTRLGGADVAGRRHAAAIEKGLGSCRKIQKSLLAELRRPDRFIALEFIAIEGVVPMRLDVNVLALRRITAIFGLLELPTIGNLVVDVRDGGKNFGRGIENIGRVRIEAVAKLAIGAEGFRTGCGKCRTEFGLARQAGTSFNGGSGYERDFEGDDFVGREGNVGQDERAVLGRGDAEFIVAWLNREDAEDAFAACGARIGLTRLEIPQGQDGAGNGNGDIGKTGITNDAVERSGGLGLLPRNAQ